MVLNAYIPSFASRVFDRYTETNVMQTISATPTTTQSFTLLPTATIPAPSVRTPSLHTRILSAIAPNVTDALREVATTARRMLVLFLGFALVLLVFYIVCTAMNLVLTRFGRGDTLGRMVARALGEWTAGIQAAWEEGWAVGAEKACDVGAKASIRRRNWPTTKGEKFVLGRQGERLFGGQMVGQDIKKVGIMALAKCEISVGDKKGLEESDMMEGGELVENHWGEGRG